jgi:hypothetical protein
MIKNTDEDQIERLNSRVAELLRERDALRDALKAAREYIGWDADTSSADLVLERINAALGAKP